jgi:MFS family permease
VLLALFLLIETRVDQPLVPLGFFRLRTATAANIVGFLMGGCGYSLFFLLTLYVQQVLDYSALQTGFAFLITAGISIPSAVLAETLVNRIGPKSVLVTGLALIAAGFLWWTQVDVDGNLVVDLLPGMILAGIGVVFAYIPNQITALSGVEERRAGLASGLIETSQTIGGAVGLAIVATAATTRTTNLLEDGEPVPVALTEGFQLGFLVAALLAIIAAVVALVLLRGVRVVPQEAPLPQATSPAFGPNRAATATLTPEILTGEAEQRPGEAPG